MQRRLAATARQCLAAMTGGCITSGWRQRGGADEPGGQRREAEAEAMSGRASERQVKSRKQREGGSW
jgi:hypothetical protein